MRLGARVGRGCAAVHDFMFRDLQVSQLHFDELWAYIGKKQKRLKKGDDPTKGDNYTFLALDALNKASQRLIAQLFEDAIHQKRLRESQVVYH